MIYKTIDLCAGIGGIRRGFEMTGSFQNVLSAEIDEAACKTYEHLFGENPKNDLTSEEFKQKVVGTEYDVLLAGFLEKGTLKGRSVVHIVHKIPPKNKNRSRGPEIDGNRKKRIETVGSILLQSFEKI